MIPYIPAGCDQQGRQRSGCRADFRDTSPYFVHRAPTAPAIWGPDNIGRYMRPRPQKTLVERVRDFFRHAWYG